MIYNLMKGCIFFIGATNMSESEKLESYRKTLEQIKNMIESERSDKDALLSEIVLIIEQELKF